MVSNEKDILIDMISPITINSKVERRSFFKLIYDYHSGNAPNTLDRAIEKIN